LVVHSPNTNDTVKIRVLDGAGGQLKEVLKNKIILQCSIRELYNDLYTPGIGLVGPDVEYSVLGEDGKRMVSDTVFRSLLPPELRKATNQHKISCCCFLCVFIDYLNSAHTKWRPTVLKKLEKENQKYQDMDGVLPRQLREAKAVALANLFTYKQEAFRDGDP